MNTSGAPGSLGPIPRLVAGIVIALLGIAGFMWSTKRGFFKPDAPISGVVTDNLGRAGEIVARQKQEELTRFLDEAERIGYVDEHVLQYIISGAGSHANDLNDSYKGWKNKHSQLGTTPQSPPTTPRVAAESPRAVHESPKAASVVEASAPEPVSRTEAPREHPERFPDVTLSVPGHNYEWTTFRNVPRVPFALQVEGELTYDPTFFKSQRTVTSFRGFDPADHNYGMFGRPDIANRFRMDLPAPNLKPGALIMRLCDAESCEAPVLVSESPFFVCGASGKWIEFRVNMPGLSADPLGGLTVRPVPAAPASCAAQ